MPRINTSLKTVLYGLLVVLLGTLLIGILLPNKYSSEVEIEVRMTPGTAFRVLSSLGVYSSWYLPQTNNEPPSFHIVGVDGTIGAQIQYLQDHGPTATEIISLKALEKIELHTTYKNKDYLMNKDEFRIESTEKSMVDVYWKKEVIYQFPFNIKAYFQSREVEIKEHHHRAADRLSNYFQSHFPTNLFDGFEVIRTQKPDYHLLVSELWTTHKSALDFNEDYFDKLALYIGNRNIPSAGMPCGLIFPAESRDSIHRAIAIPLRDEYRSKRLNYLFIKGGEALQLRFNGTDAQSYRAKRALRNYAQTYGLNARDTLLVEYLSFPQMGNDTVPFQTQLVMFFEEERVEN